MKSIVVVGAAAVAAIVAAAWAQQTPPQQTQPAPPAARTVTSFYVYQYSPAGCPQKDGQQWLTYTLQRCTGTVIDEVSITDPTREQRAYMARGGGGQSCETGVEQNVCLPPGLTLCDPAKAPEFGQGRTLQQMNLCRRDGAATSTDPVADPSDPDTDAEPDADDDTEADDQPNPDLCSVKNGFPCMNVDKACTRSDGSAGVTYMLRRHADEGPWRTNSNCMSARATAEEVFADQGYPLK